MNLGIRAHDFGKGSPEEMAAKIAAKKFSSIQLALPKAIEGVNFGLGSLNPGMAHYIGGTFAKAGIQIAVLGCYINPVDPNIDERRSQLDRFKENIRYARAFGSTIVATETGTISEDLSPGSVNYGEEAFNILVESVSELVEEAERFGVFVGIEGVCVHTINTPKKMKRLIDTIKSNNLQVVFDPVNFINRDNYRNADYIIKESMELFGDRIVALHAKDFIMDKGVKKILPPGKGILNYKMLMDQLKYRKPYINILIEDINVADMEDSMAYIKVYNEYL